MGAVDRPAGARSVSRRQHRHCAAGPHQYRRLPASADCRHVAGCALWKRRRSAGPAQSAYHRAAQVDKAGGVAVGAASGVQGDGLAAQGTQSAPVGVDLHIAFPR